MQDSMARIAEQLAKTALPSTVRLRVEQDQGRSQFIAASRAKELRSQLDYAQTAEGKRFFDDSGVNENGRHIHRTSYCDGRRCANVQYSETDVPKIVQISNTFMNEAAHNARAIPYPLRSYYVGPMPLLEVLPSAEFLPETEVLGRKCDVLHFGEVGSVRKEDFVVSLDRETAVPLRSAVYESKADYQASKPSWVWEADSFDASDAHPVVRDSTLRRYVTVAGNGPTDADIGKVNMTTRIHVKDYEVDTPIPESTFWFKPQPGVTVIDTLPPQKSASTLAVATPVPGPGEAIRVGEPASIPWGGVGFACGLFAVLAIVTRTFQQRRRSR